MSILKLQQGVTLIELIITVMILGVIVSIAAPKFSSQISNSRSVATSSDFMEALSNARSQARSRSGMVVLCPADSSGTSCGTNWGGGWLIATDSSASETDANVSIGNVLFWINDVSSKAIIATDHNFIRFNSKGFLASTNGTTADITIGAEGCEGPAARVIHIEASGIASVTKVDCASIAEDN